MKPFFLQKLTKVTLKKLDLESSGTVNAFAFFG